MVEFAHIGIVGFGTMGSGIAQVFAGAGLQVTAVEVDAARLQAGMRTIAGVLDGSVARGKLSPADMEATLQRVRTTTRVADLAGADLVIETVTEDLDAKRGALAEVGEILSVHVPLVTNTSALSVTELGAGLPNPSRFAGLHFFNPAPFMRTVEVVRSLQTDGDLVDRLVTLVKALGDKEPVVVRDRPGFLVNALLIPYLNDAITELDVGLATAEDIDIAVRLGLGHKSGPFEMLDMIGLDVQLAASDYTYQTTRDVRYAPPPLLKQMVSVGMLGDKNGRGFRTGERDSQ